MAVHFSQKFISANEITIFKPTPSTIISGPMNTMMINTKYVPT